MTTTCTRNVGNHWLESAIKLILLRSSLGMIMESLTTSVLLRVRNRIARLGWTDLTILVSFKFSLRLSTDPLQGWLSMTSYYATAFKTGTYPTVSEDQIVMWSRPHPAFASAPDPVGPPTNYQIVGSFFNLPDLSSSRSLQTADKIWVVVFATSPATVTLSTSTTDSQTFNVSVGVTKLSLPITAGGYMKAVLERNGQTVINLQPHGFYFNPSPPSYNYNAFVISSS